MPDASDEATGAADAPASDTLASDAPVSAADAAAEQKRRFREALERKQVAQHPHDEVAGGKNLHGRGGASARQEFRRKSG